MNKIKCFGRCSVPYKNSANGGSGDPMSRNEVWGEAAGADDKESLRGGEGEEGGGETRDC